MPLQRPTSFDTRQSKLTFNGHHGDNLLEKPLIKLFTQTFTAGIHLAVVEEVFEDSLLK